MAATLTVRRPSAVLASVKVAGLGVAVYSNAGLTAAVTLPYTLPYGSNVFYLNPVGEYDVKVTAGAGVVGTLTATAFDSPSSFTVAYDPASGGAGALTIRGGTP